MSLLHIDSPAARAINKFVQMVYVGLLWFLCSIPIITLGAATVAMYEVLLKMAKDQEGAIGAAFFRGFKANLRASLPVWIPILLAEIIFSVNLFYYAILGGDNFLVQSVVFGILLVLSLTLFGFAFPIMARFEDTAAGTFRMAVLLMIRNPGWMLVIGVMQTLTVLICWCFLFFPLLFIMGIFGYAQAVIFNRIFDPLIEQGKIVESGQAHDL
ncbi:MAG: YesL family protein [Oscillospiraceae bacterium]|nr:YesL family protein [Oscillospiraceae bacterium]